MTLFRIDDVSINTPTAKLQKMIDLLFEKFGDPIVWCAISPLVHASDDERVFPPILGAHSDWREYFKVDRCFIPSLDSRVEAVSHGLVHVDHRLLPEAAQEMSIIISCSLIGTKIMVPAFNKWNIYTEAICEEHGIELVKWEDGWRHLKFWDSDTPPPGAHAGYYFHTFDFTIDQFKERIDVLSGRSAEVPR